MISARFPTEIETSMRGFCREKAAIRRGAKYLAVETTPTVTRPAFLSRMAVSVLSRSFRTRLIRVAALTTSWPASVRRKRPPTRSNKRVWASSSRCFMREVKAAAVTFSVSAAMAIVPAWATARMVINCLRVNRRIHRN